MPGEQGFSGLKIALLPFENNSGRREAVTRIMPIVRDYLIRSGYGLLDEQDVEGFLARKRIRRTGEISRKAAREIREELGADFVLVGSVEVFDEEDGLHVGLSCRLVDSSNGSITRAESSGIAGEDFTTLLGFGTIKSMDLLVDKAVEDLFRGWDGIPIGEKGAPSTSRQREGRPMIALFPFENISGRRAAGRIVSNILISRLVQKGACGVVEPGEVRYWITRLRVRYLEAIGIEAMSKLGREAGADYLLLGIVVDYREGVGEGFPPRVEMNVRMVDVEKGRMVWAGKTSMTGDDFLIALDFGKIRSTIPLVKKASDSIIAGMGRGEGEKREWRPAGNMRWEDLRRKTQDSGRKTQD
jgi:TolB-like protein